MIGTNVYNLTDTVGGETVAVEGNYGFGILFCMNGGAFELGSASGHFHFSHSKGDPFDPDRDNVQFELILNDDGEFIPRGDIQTNQSNYCVEREEDFGDMTMTLALKFEAWNLALGTLNFEGRIDTGGQSVPFLAWAPVTLSR